MAHLYPNENMKTRASVLIYQWWTKSCRETKSIVDKWSFGGTWHVHDKNDNSPNEGRSRLVGPSGPANISSVVFNLMSFLVKESVSDYNTEKKKPTKQTIKTHKKRHKKRSRHISKRKCPMKAAVGRRSLRLYTCITAKYRLCSVSITVCIVLEPVLDYFN